MNFKKIKSITSKEFRTAWKIYLNSFPRNERRSLKQQKLLFRKKEYAMYAVVERKEIIAFLSIWIIEFSFIEHFAIKKQFRNKGLGSKILKNFIKKKRIILEVEPGETKLAVRRINFYKKLGFKLNKFNHIQPAYSKAKKPIKLYIMSYPNKLSKINFEKIQKLLYKKVYGK